MLRRNFIRSALTVASGCLLTIRPKDIKEDLPDYDVAVITIKKNGKIYKLGFELTNDKEQDKKGLGFLAHAAQMTIHPTLIRKFV